MKPDDLTALVSGGGLGVVGVLSFFIIMFIRGYIVPRFVYDELAKERDYWRSIADRTLTTAERIVPPVDAGRR